MDSRLNIIYEDNHIIAAVKPSGVLSQSDGSNAPDMLTILKGYIKEKYSKPGDVYLGLVHRLDRPVSGLMVFARTSKAASRLSSQIREKKFTKLYRAVVSGRLEGQGVLVDYILKDPKTNTVTVSDKPSELAKRADLEYTSAGFCDGFTLVNIALGTGRSHQIRSQLAHAGHPIAGDRKYGYKGRENCDIALQAYKLGFTHPTLKEYMEFEIEAPQSWPWNLDFKADK